MTRVGRAEDHQQCIDGLHRVADLMQEVQGALVELAEVRRELVRCLVMFGFTQAEIARETGLSKARVQQLVQGS